MFRNIFSAICRNPGLFINDCSIFPNDILVDCLNLFAIGSSPAFPDASLFIFFVFFSNFFIRMLLNETLNWNESQKCLA